LVETVDTQHKLVVLVDNKGLRDIQVLLLLPVVLVFFSKIIK
jgi:hypothetical protein